MKKPSKNEPDIVALITQVQEQLAALDRKVDALMSKCAPQPVFRPPVPAEVKPQEQPKARPMFPAVCADCKQSCEIPFKPGPDRPVYCKECFGRRKNRHVTPPPAAPVEAVVHAAPVVVKLSVEEKKRPAAAKKPSVKKVVVKKKK